MNLTLRTIRRSARRAFDALQRILAAAFFRHAPSPAIAPSEPCVRCGAPCRKPKSGPTSRFCSRLCRVRSRAVARSCRGCGATLPPGSGRHRWCSVRCERQSHVKGSREFACERCGKVGETLTRGASGAKFCSSRCRWDSRPAREVTCPHCGKTWSTFIRKARFCSVRCADKARRAARKAARKP